MSPQTWIEFIRAEYLERFIQLGGTSIKFVVSLGDLHPSAVEREIHESASAANYLSASISAADTRIHMVDHIFFRIAEQIPWRSLSENVLLRLALEHGYPGLPKAGPESFAQRLADANEIDVDVITMEARRWVARSVYKRHDLVLESRIAMTQLCLAELTGGPEGEATIAAITDWLTGRNRTVSAVKSYQIVSRITRTNARHMLESTLRWIRGAGFPGLVITMDLSRFETERNPRDGALFYSRAQLLDAYETLRQFIDSTEHLQSCLVVVLAHESFLDGDSRGRGMAAYQALNFRVFDEVHDQRFANPMGALMRLSVGGQN